MAKAGSKLPRKRLRVTLDDAIYISGDRIHIDLHTPQGDLMIEVNALCFASLVGEVANSMRCNPFEQSKKPKLIA